MKRSDKVMIATGCIAAICCILNKKKNAWIPVSERLPENKHNVLVTVQNKQNKPFVEIDFISKDEWEAFEDNVIAWKELPEPYKKGKEQ